MLRVCLIAFSSLFFLSAYSQTKEEVTSFIEDVVYPNHMINDFEYHYLDSLSIPFRSFDYRRIEDFEEFLKENPDFDLSKSKTAIEDATAISWKDYKLHKARICNKDSLQSPLNQGIREYVFVKYKDYNKIKKVTKNKIVTPIRWYWGKKKIKKQRRKYYDIYRKEWKIEDYQCFQFSKPLFIDDTYVIIKTCGGQIGCQGFIYALKDNVWKEYEYYSNY